MKVRIRFRIGQPLAAEADTGPFSGIAHGRVPRPMMLIGSVALHALMVLVVTVVSSELSAWMKDDDLDWSRYQVEPLRLHLLQPLIYRASGFDRPKAVASGTRVKATRSAVRAPRRPYVPNQLELPAPRVAARNIPVILQPEYNAQASLPPAPLPPLAFWARQSGSAPKPTEGVLVPGRTELDSPAPDLATAPAASVPNLEQAAADLNASLPRTQSVKVPALPLPNSSTNPVRVREQAGARAASFEQFAGQPANAIVMAGARPEVTDVRIPRGLQNIPAPAGGDDAGGMGAQAQPLSNGTAGASPTKVVGSGARSANGTPPSPSPNHVDSHTTPVTSAGGNLKTAREEPSPGAEPTPARPQEIRGITRVAHPSKGRFDVVITQSGASTDDLAGTAGALVGSPVYTVYLQVGDRREWLLEYCLAAGENTRMSANRANGNDSSPITPPYPISTAIPNDVLVESIADHIVIHGFLTAGGSLRDTAVPNMKTALTAHILALLDEWRFRPAFRKDNPVEIEVLLIIPARS